MQPSTTIQTTTTLHYDIAQVQCNTNAIQNKQAIRIMQNTIALQKQTTMQNNCNAQHNNNKNCNATKKVAAILAQAILARAILAQAILFQAIGPKVMEGCSKQAFGPKVMECCSQKTFCSAQRPFRSTRNWQIQFDLPGVGGMVGPLSIFHVLIPCFLVDLPIPL